MMETTPDDVRRRCYACYRPEAECICGDLPAIENRTELLILQHRREQFHAFNTARLVRQSLRNSTFLVDHKDALRKRLVLKPGAALLFPGRDAELLGELPAERRPRQLVVVDGTWHQAKTLVRDIPELASLPRVCLQPASPSNYRIRREPNAAALSTVEAVVDALRTLEPETRGFDELIAAFRRMVDRQAEHPKLAGARRSLARRGEGLGNIPGTIVRRWEQIVVAYGEAEEGRREDDVNERSSVNRPLVWIAERLATGERFLSIVRPQSPLNDRFVQHLELPRSMLEQGEPLETARERWRTFLREDDFLVVYHPGAARLAQQMANDHPASLILKAIDDPVLRRVRDLDSLTAALSLSLAEPWHPGRAARRLAQTIALAQHLRVRRAAP